MLLDDLAVEHRALGEQALVGPLVVQVGQNFLAAQQASQTLLALVVENSDFVFEVLFELRIFSRFDRLGALVLLLRPCG